MRWPRVAACPRSDIGAKGRANISRKKSDSKSHLQITSSKRQQDRSMILLIRCLLQRNPRKTTSLALSSQELTLPPQQIICSWKKSNRNLSCYIQRPHRQHQMNGHGDAWLVLGRKNISFASKSQDLYQPRKSGSWVFMIFRSQSRSMRFIGS